MSGQGWLSEELQHARKRSREAGERFLDARLVADLARDAEDEAVSVHALDAEVAREVLWEEYRSVETLERALEHANRNPGFPERLRSVLFSHPDVIAVIESEIQRDERVERTIDELGPIFGVDL